ncbi:MAG: hypothetical protein ACXWAT_03585 [Methylobacter sp.]
METLKLVQKFKKENPSKTPYCIKAEDEPINLFPQPRYFQVHFQHVHENAHDLRGELAQLKDYVTKVDEKLERVMALLSRTPEHVL